MSSSRDRQRAAARARLERELAARAAEQARKRRRTAIIAGSTAGGALVIVLVIVLIVSLTGGSKKKPTASASASPSAATLASCTWTSATNPSPAPSAADSAAPSAAPSASASPSAKPTPNPYLKNVGTPNASGLPNTGTETMTINTNLGPISVSVDVSKVPCAAASFSYLASKKFFDNTSCYRMHDSGYYIIQCGDPSGTGKGGPTYTYAPENTPAESRPTYTTGEVAVGTPPTAGNNGSQFFIVYKNTEDDPSQTSTPTSILPGQFTVLGTVTSGMDVVQKVAAGGLTPASKSDPNTGKPKTPLNITTLTMSAAGASSGS